MGEAVSDEDVLKIAEVAREKYDQENYEEAIEYYERAISLKPSEEDYELLAPLYAELGWSYEQIGKYDLALMNLKKALYDEEYDLREGLYFSIGNCLLELDRIEESMDWFKRILESSKEPRRISEAMLGFGKAYYFLKDYRRSLEYLKKAKKRCPDIPGRLAEILLYMGHNYYVTGKAKKAERCYQKAIEVSLPHFDYRAPKVGLVETYFTQGKLEKAISKAEELVQDREEYGRKELLVVLASSYLRLGNKEKAIEYAQKLKKLYPDTELKDMYPEVWELAE